MNREDKAWRDFSERFRRDGLPKILSSAVFLSIGSEVGTFDVKQAVELGAALLLDKPMLLVVPKGRRVGEHMRRVADELVEDWDPEDPRSQERLTGALARLAGGP